MRASLHLTAERGRIYAAVAALCTVAALALAAMSPQSAHAEFTLKPCEGGPVQGEGSSFQNAAQGEFKLVFNSSFGCEGSLSKSPVTYVSDGSGCGIASIGGGGSSGKCSDFEITGEIAKGGYRDPDTRFGGSDAPLTPEQMVAADAKGGTHPGLIHILPTAVGATAVIVHFPEGCKLENPALPGGNGNTSTGGLKAGEKGTGSEVEGQNNDPAGAGYTGDKFSEGTLRLHIPAGTLEEIWGGKSMTWGEVTKDKMTGKPTNALEVEEGFTTSCNEVPIRRIVRFDGSGTTYNFKAYLSLLPVGIGGSTTNEVWTKSPVVGTGTNWPLTTGSTGVPKPVPTTAGTKEFVNECNETVSGPSRICTGSANGNPFVAAAVAATDGSIGYSDLATARQNGFTITPESKNSGKPDDTYWIPLQTINPEDSVSTRVGSNYVEPTISPTSNIGNGAEVRGSNCTSADYRGVPPITASDPDPTLGDWANAIGTGSKDTITYPNCAITYDFVWDDDAPVYGNTPEEQAKARTIKDYFSTVESGEGQLAWRVKTMARCRPRSSISRASAWKRSAGTSRPGAGTNEQLQQQQQQPPNSASTSSTLASSTVSTPPSNAFSIASAKVKGKDIVLSLVLPGAGQVQIKATGGGVTVSSVSASVGGGQGTVTLPISSAALKKIAKAKGKKLSVTITVTFTPTGGTAASQTKTLTITQAAISPPRRKEDDEQKEERQEAGLAGSWPTPRHRKHTAPAPGTAVWRRAPSVL